MSSLKQVWVILICVLLYTSASAQDGQRTRASEKSSSAVNLSGFGSTGQIPKFGGGDFLINSIITELNGHIGIGTQSPTSVLTVAGSIETTAGGIKFPDGTVQTTSAAGSLFQVIHDSSLTG